MPAIQLGVLLIVVVAWVAWWRWTPHRVGDKIALGLFTAVTLGWLTAPLVLVHPPAPGCRFNGLGESCSSASGAAGTATRRAATTPAPPGATALPASQQGSPGAPVEITPAPAGHGLTGPAGHSSNRASGPRPVAAARQSTARNRAGPAITTAWVQAPFCTIPPKGQLPPAPGEPSIPTAVPVVPAAGPASGQAQPPASSAPPVARRATPDIVLTPVTPPEPCAEMAFDVTDADRIAAVDGGVAHVSVDGGRTWTSVSVPADVTCVPSYTGAQFTSEGEPACAATWGGNRLYLTLDGAVESYAPGKPTGGWTKLASQLPTGRCDCPEEAVVDSFSVSPEGRWALAFHTGSGIGNGWWVETGQGNAFHRVEGWGGRVWPAQNGYGLWGGPPTRHDMFSVTIDSFRPYASTDGVAWEPVATSTEVDAGIGRDVAIDGGTVYGLQFRGETEPPLLQASRDGGRTWTAQTLWPVPDPADYYGRLWAGSSALVLATCPYCGRHTTRIHTDALDVSLDGGATWHVVTGLPSTFPLVVGSGGHVLRVAVSGRRLWVAIGHPPYWYTGLLP